MTLKSSAIIEATILVVICVASVFVNIILFVVILRKRTLRTISNGFLLNLAFADLLVSMLNMPITVVTIINESWIFGDTACVFFGFITMLSFVSSVMSLAMIAINRYYYVVQWKNYSSNFTPRKSLLFVGSMWITSVSLSIPPLLGWGKYDFISGKSFCFVFWPSDVYYMYFMLIICFFGPLTVICITYIKILKFTRRAKQQMHRHRENNVIEDASQKMEENRRRIGTSQEEVKITNTLVIVVACFVGCWAPFAVTMFIDVYLPSSRIPRSIDISTLLLGYANSMCNPVVYGIRNQTFRRELIQVFTICRRPQRVSVGNVPYPSKRRASSKIRTAKKMGVSELPHLASSSKETASSSLS